MALGGPGDTGWPGDSRGMAREAGDTGDRQERLGGVGCGAGAGVTGDVQESGEVVGDTEGLGVQGG